MPVFFVLSSKNSRFKPMKRPHGIFEIARDVLEQAGRPLNVRAIIRSALRDGLFSGAVPEADELQAALEEGAARGLCVEVRKGIFGLMSGDGEVQDVRHVERHSPVPASLDEAASQMDAGDDRALRQKLWKNLRSSVANHLGLTEEEPVEEKAAPVNEKAAPVEEPRERPTRARERRLEARRREREAAAEANSTKPQETVETKAAPEVGRHQETAQKAALQLKAASKAAVAKAVKESAKESNRAPAKEEKPAAKKLSVADRLREKWGVARKGPMPKLSEILEQAEAKKAALAVDVEEVDLSKAVATLMDRLHAHWARSPLAKPAPVELESVSKSAISEKRAAEKPTEERRARSRRSAEAASAMPSVVEAVVEKPVEEKPLETGRERRRDRFEKAERRAPRMALLSCDALVAAAFDLLSQAGAPMAGPALVEAVEKRLPARGLKAAILGDNAHRLASGLRARFELCNDGTVALTEWKLSARYLEAEEKWEKAQREMQSALNDELQARVSNLRDGAFSCLLAMVLERLGYSQFGPIQQQGSLWKFTARHQSGSSVETVALAVQRRATALEAVDHWCDEWEEIHAARGIWIAFGEVSDELHESMSACGDRIDFVDGERFANWLCQTGVGLLAGSRSFVDLAFFESLN